MWFSYSYTHKSHNHYIKLANPFHYINQKGNKLPFMKMFSEVHEEFIWFHKIKIQVFIEKLNLGYQMNG